MDTLDVLLLVVVVAFGIFIAWRNS